MISQDTIDLCLELIAGVKISVGAPDAEATTLRIFAARRELLAALDKPAELSVNRA